VCDRSPSVGVSLAILKFTKTDIRTRFEVNCLTEIFIDRALARAVELNEHLKCTGSVVGLLHGE